MIKDLSLLGLSFPSHSLLLPEASSEPATGRGGRGAVSLLGWALVLAGLDLLPRADEEHLQRRLDRAVGDGLGARSTITVEGNELLTGRGGDFLLG